MFADDIEIGRLGATNVRKTKFAELGVVLHPNPLRSQGEKYKPADLELMEEALTDSGLKLRREPSLCGGEDGALRFPGVGHRVDAPPTHWQYSHITEFRYFSF